MKVIGLQFGHTYDFTETGEKEWKTLRYGFIAGLTDQDLDGFNIFGLLCTFLLTYWPSLVKREFIRRINTPLVRAYPIKNKKTIPVKEFYSEKQVKEWLDLEGEEHVKKNYDVRYYKGLATHRGAFGEVKRMFINIDNKICFYTLDEKAIRSMYIFYGTETYPRKIALSNNHYKTPIEGLELPLSQHFEIETKSFQRDNIIRKLLSTIDGFVEGRRKVFYTARKLGNVIMKVAGLAADVANKANYHHGEASVEQTIVRMAQGFPGARILPILQPHGNFGTRDQGYKNAGASRYIFTTINHRLVDKLFRKEDEYILTYNMDDGTRYEPKYYVPIIPYVLCESNELPATGWSICVHARDLNAIFKNLRALIKGEIDKCSELPIDRSNFTGSIRNYNGKRYFVGKYTYDEKNNTVKITELILIF